MLVEQKQRMVTEAFKVPVVGRALLSSAGLTDGTVQIQNEFFERSSPVDVVDPAAGEIHQRREIASAAERLGLESADLATRRRLFIRLTRPSANHVASRRVHTQPLGVVDIFVACQSAADRLPQQRDEQVLPVAVLAWALSTPAPVSISPFPSAR
ncbi:MAG: hypothetical protein OSA98_04470, partial [Rubripirellula sp.]|nr:hypothetical protein [Rubripirellula sp.]